MKHDNQVCYLLLYLGIPFHSRPHSRTHLIAAEKAGKALNIEIWPVHLRHKTNNHQTEKYLFKFPKFRREDKRALRLAESILYAVSIIYGPIVTSYETSLVFRIPAKLIRNRNQIFIDDLIQIVSSRKLDKQITFYPPERPFVSAIYIPEFYIEEAWRITPIIFQNKNLYQAVRFLKASQDDFYIWDGEISEVLAEPQLSAESSLEQSRLENALQNAFKAVESVLGDPPKDDRKFFLKIKDIGLDPYENVGYINKLPLYKVIRDMNEARDKKAAHGTSLKRTITIGEMLEYQTCARYIVLSAIKHGGGTNFV